MNKNLNLKSVLITGCSSGIGYELVVSFLKKGYRVFATARKKSDLDILTGLGASAIHCELTDSVSIRTCIDFLHTQVSSLDFLINNAAYAQPAAVLDLSSSDMSAQFQVNVFGTLELTRLLLPLLEMSVSPRIFFLSSILGVLTVPYLGAYCASKQALESFASALRMELLNKKVKVIMIRPGKIATPFHKTALAKFDHSIDKFNSLYAHGYSEYLQKRANTSHDSQKGLHPRAVVKVIERVMFIKNPRIAYYVTWQAKLLGRMRCFFTQGLLERLIARFS